MNTEHRRRAFHHSVAAAFWLTITSLAQAQWTTESYPLEGGWSALWLSQDCSHADIPSLLPEQSGIEEVWQWNPLGSTTQFTESPWLPIQPDAAWKVWKRTDADGSTLARLSGNAAYLIKTKAGTPAFNLPLTGKPVLPRYEFTTTGSNLVGFPVQEPAAVPMRSFERFFSYSAVFKVNPPVYSYLNGPLSSLYPVQALPRTTPVQRGKAYWIKNDVYGDYYGPLKITLLGDGIDFAAARNLVTLRLRNVVDPAKNLSVTATLTPAASATPPSGHAPVAGPVPLQVRGQRDPQTLEFLYEPITAAGLSRTLAPGEETEVILSVNRPEMGGSPGSVFQSLLKVTDSLEQTSIVLPVRAETTSYAGLWAGAAVVRTVDQVVGQQINKDEAAPSTFTLRLLLHRSPTGETTLLQQVHLGEKAGVPVAGVNEAAVKAAIDGNAGRMSSAHFPLSLAQLGTGQLGLAGPVSFQVDSGYNSATNPFVHTYHPDHDNLDARFERLLPDGTESFTVRREVQLNFLNSLPGVSDPGWGSTTLGGTYKETIAGLRTVPLTVTGNFLLHRVSTAPSLIP
jgi:hypothetical protein